jgi:hypothetical protein
LPWHHSQSVTADIDQGKDVATLVEDYVFNLANFLVRAVLDVFAGQITGAEKLLRLRLGPRAVGLPCGAVLLVRAALLGRLRGRCCARAKRSNRADGYERE